MGKKEFSYNVGDLDEGRAALLLAMTSTIEEEERFKEYLRNELGYRCCAVEVGGTVSVLSNGKILKSTITAALREKVIEEDRKHLHAVIHATLEAQNGVVYNIPTANASLALKIAVTRGDKWICVGIFGNSAYSILTEHHRAGLGIMHY
ncbi:MAG: HutP family protein [Thermoanaerobacteraceae bacterium]|nr:HutP family protein [Thermoanaerobacteraceae bacterium]